MAASHVSAIAAAAPSEAAAHFAHKLSLETDCWDVHESLKDGPVDFVLLDVRGRQAYARGHVPGAISLPHADITAERMMSWPHDHAVRRLLRRPALQRRRPRRAAARQAGPPRQDHDRRRHRLGRRRLRLLRRADEMEA